MTLESTEAAPPPTVEGLHEHALRARRAVAHYLSRAPATHVLFLIICITTLSLRGVDAVTVSRVLRHQSTNLVEMAHDAPRVLLLSAFVTTQGRLWREAVRFTLVFVPVERWLGTYRWLIVFAGAHVGASVATTLGIWLQATRGGAGRDLLTPIDVGISYGLAGAAGVLTYRLPRKLGLAVALALIGSGIYGVVHSGTFTDWGHLTALFIGFGLGPLVRPEAPAVPPAPADEPLTGLPAAWHWLATPPPPRHLTRARTARAGAAVCLAATIALALAVPAARHHPVLVPAAGEVVRATVLGHPPGCARLCTSTVLRYARGSHPVEALLATPANLLLRPGEHLAVRVDPAEPGRARLVVAPRRVRVDGLLSSLTVIGLCLTVILVLVAHHEVSEPAGR